MRHTETPYISLKMGESESQGKPMNVREQEFRKKRMPPCDRADKDSRFIPTRKGTDVRQVFLCEKICVIFFGKESK